MHSSGSQVVERLRDIWQELLNRSPLNTNESFFSLGGSPSLAEELFAEINRLFSVELSPLFIYQAPTIATLAALLSKERSINVSPLLLMNTGAAGPPLFLAHGLGDTVMSLFELVRHIPFANPIYGMQARGVDGVTEPMDRIEDMAQYHLDAMRILQPRGPYFLAGYSLGGLVALEVAQRLLTCGEKIGLLAMLDSYPDRRHFTLGQQAQFAWQLSKRCITTLGRPKPLHSVKPLGSVARAMPLVREKQYQALRAYRPRFYDGQIKFVRPEISTFFPENPLAIWAHLTRAFELETVPGDHLQMLTTQVIPVASKISTYLKEALSQPWRIPL